MNIHLPAILRFTRYQGFDPSPIDEHGDGNARESPAKMDKNGPVTGPENSASPQAMMNVIEYLLVF